MTTYPSGVLQNYSTPNMPPDLKPVPQQNWSWFGTQVDAEVGLGMIRELVPDAEMSVATQGMYSQYWYVLPDSDIRCRLAYGKLEQPGVGVLNILEYPSEILDASITPRPFIDTYQKGQVTVLKCRAVTPVDGELYWAALDQK